MKLLLLDTRNDKHYTGDTRADLVEQMVASGFIAIRLSDRMDASGIYPTKTHKAVIDVKGYTQPITLSFSDQYTDDERTKEVNRGLLNQLCNCYEFIAFKNIAAD